MIDSCYAFAHVYANADMSICNEGTIVRIDGVMELREEWKCVVLYYIVYEHTCETPVITMFLVFVS